LWQFGGRWQSVFTTKALMMDYIKQKEADDGFLCVDGTYCLNKILYPSIITGTVDIRKKFHLDFFNNKNFH